jgi:outer membrane protein assembly factor BamA
MESSERPFIAAGGYQSLRGYYDARFVGPGKLLGGLELRYAPVMSPSVFELVIAGFYDTGRVFGPGESFHLTTDGLHSSGGVEVAARFLRNSLVIVGVGAASEGAQLLFGTQWSY